MKRISYVLLVCALLIPATAWSIPIDGLVANFTFSGNANDSSGNNLNGSVDGATLTTDRFGNVDSAYYFDGVDDVITVQNNALLNFGTSDFSISVWVRALDQTSSVNKGIIAKRNSYIPTGAGYTLGLSGEPTDQYASAMICDGSSSKLCMGSEASLDDALWHNIIFMADRDGLGQIYIDGVLNGSPLDISSQSGYVGNDLPLFIGKYYSSWLDEYYFRGDIDDILIYNRILSELDIQDIINDSYPVPVPEPSTMLLLGFGLVGLAGFSRNRINK